MTIATTLANAAAELRANGDPVDNLSTYHVATAINLAAGSAPGLHAACVAFMGSLNLQPLNAYAYDDADTLEDEQAMKFDALTLASLIAEEENL